MLDIIENQNYRLEMPRNCPHSIYELMLTCWSLEPASRPTFARLHQAFSENPEYNDISSHWDLYQCPGDLWCHECLSLVAINLLHSLSTLTPFHPQVWVERVNGLCVCGSCMYIMGVCWTLIKNEWFPVSVCVVLYLGLCVHVHVCSITFTMCNFEVMLQASTYVHW